MEFVAGALFGVLVGVALMLLGVRTFFTGGRDE